MRTCWLCGKNGADEPLDRHHIFGGANRRKSEKLGLVVDLCHGSCHIFGERAAHRCRETAQALHEYGQRLAMERMGWSTADFVREFGRNYLDEGADAETAANGEALIPSVSSATPSRCGSVTARDRQPTGLSDNTAPPLRYLGHQGEAENGIGFEVTDFELCVNW